MANDIKTSRSLGPGGTVYPSVDALAAELGISRQAAYAALRENKIPCIRLGRRFILPKSAISEWLRSAADSGSGLRAAAVSIPGTGSQATRSGRTVPRFLIGAELENRLASAKFPIQFFREDGQLIRTLTRQQAFERLAQGRVYGVPSMGTVRHLVEFGSLRARDGAVAEDSITTDREHKHRWAASNHPWAAADPTAVPMVDFHRAPIVPDLWQLELGRQLKLDIEKYNFQPSTTAAQFLLLEVAGFIQLRDVWSRSSRTSD